MCASGDNWKFRLEIPSFAAGDKNFRALQNTVGIPMKSGGA
jgi:hypothetical protein